MSEERKLIIEIAKLWPRHAGVNFTAISNKNLLLLIKDAVEGTIESTKILKEL